jgi:hypothetical protein
MLRGATHTAAAVDCHLRCPYVLRLFSHASDLRPLVRHVRGNAAVEKAHREAREAFLELVRRQVAASDCARTRDGTRILRRFEQ